MSGMYRPPPPKSASKASASTICQKCLKRDKSIGHAIILFGADILARHYSYECKAEAQARPYVARPSRTQQLFNPKLAPKLTNDAPNDLLRKTGVADEQLAQFAAERKRNRSRSGSVDRGRGIARRARSRSAVSDASSSSVSTISTNRSRTHSSPGRGTQSQHDTYMTSQSQHSHPAYLDHERDYRGGKRQRSPSMEPESDAEADNARNTRRRRNVRSPEQRGRGRDRLSQSRSRERETRSRSYSKSRGARQPREPSLTRAGPSRSQSPVDDDRRRGGHRQTHSRRDDYRNASPRRAPPPARERSLSPFSKRLALTQAMGRGR